MNKSTKILIIAISIISIIALLAVFAIIFINISNLTELTNIEKTPITVSKFMTIMKTKDFELVDITEQFSQYDGYMNKGYVATNGNYNIEFYVLSSIDNAVKMYNTNKSNFEAQKGNKSTSSSNSFKNSSQYSLTTNGKYKHLSRIDNTFLYLNIDEIYKTEVIEILQELGY